MYLKNIVIKNIGPISELSVELPFNENGTPKPLLFVGENGSGKTFLQSQIVDSLYEIGSNLFTDVGKGNSLKRSYYKISGGVNLKSGCDKGFSLLSYEDNEKEKIEYLDKIGEVTKEEITAYINNFSLPLNNKSDNQKIVTDINGDKKSKLTNEWISGVHFYQPAYRYEEPMWKNKVFRDETRFEDNRNFSGVLGKEIEVISANNINKSYLLDLVLDITMYPNDKTNNILWQSMNIILQKIKKIENIRFGIGPRGQYRVAIGEMNKKGKWIKDILPSIDGLSLGESILLNLFINIIRHGDTPPKKHEDISGIVAIDEIDVHLHSDLQNTVLPELLRKFPKVQFIITTHSPLFILGMKREFGEDGFEIRNMPNGEVITTERFSEFENAYDILKNTEKFDKDMNQQIKDSQKPIVFVEGDYDIRYIKKASELLGKQEFIDKVTFIDADGYQNLNHIWKHNTNLFKAIPQKMLLLYDCDTKVENKTKEKVYKRIIPYIQENHFDRGIENLFPKTTINKAIEYKKAFIDYTAETKQTKRGIENIIPEKYDVNPDEKGNLCTWLCENGTEEDFVHFDKVFGIFEEFLSEEETRDNS